MTMLGATFLQLQNVIWLYQGEQIKPSWITFLQDGCLAYLASEV